MSCIQSPTATQYAVFTSFTPSTSYSQSAPNTQQVTTIVSQSCIASGTISGSSVGCISSAPVTQVNTVGGGGQAAQVPIVVSVPVAESQPTQTLFAPCSSGESSSASQSSAQPSTNSPIPTSILVQSTPPPSTVVEASSTTLADGSIVQTVITVVSTFPASSVYLPTSVANPALQSSQSQSSGTNVAPIVGGVLGGFFGLIAIVASLWWLCCRRRSWDDVFEKEDLQNDDAWEPPVRHDRHSRRLRSSIEPEPYQYGLVGHVVPPAAAGESLRSSHYSSVSEHSGVHSRHTSSSATPLLQTTHSSRPSTAASVLTVQTRPRSRVLNPVGGSETPRSLSMVSQTNSTRPLLDSPSTPALLSSWTPNTDDLAVLGSLDRTNTGSPVPPTERRILQIVNDGSSSPTETISPRQTSLSNVIMHTDGGRVPDSDPPAYSR